MQRRDGTERVADDLFGAWIALSTPDPKQAAALRLDLAVVRGLLLDLLVTGDRAATNRAFERYLSLVERA
jgi:hypothetical protein